MLTTIRHIALQSKVCHHVGLPLLIEIIPPHVVERVLDECQAWEQREKKLNMRAMIYFIIALSLFSGVGMREVWRRLVEGWRRVWPQGGCDIPTAGALSQRRKQLGVLPLRRLFEACVHPIATAQTPGAFRFGLRVVAADSSLDNVADTDANRAVYRYSRDEETSRSPFPQVRCVLLMECGTHVIFDADFCSCREGEQPALLPLLQRSLTAGMLLTCDSGISCTSVFQLARKTGAHVLGRLRSTMWTKPWVRLSDGSYLVRVTEDCKHQRGHLLTVRVIEYTITDPALPGYGQRHRLATTLLDPQRYPALDLIQFYHQRWQIEEAIDEWKTHLRLSARTWRSQTPEGVEQELYGLLLAHFALRTLIHQGALAADLDPDELSFTHALCVLQRSLWSFALTPLAEHEQLRQSLCDELLEERVPTRPLPFQPRLVKRTRSKYERKCYEHLRVPCFDQPFHHFVTLI